MNIELLEAAKDLLRWVLIKNEGTLPLPLLDAQHVIMEEQREQDLEDLRHSERASFHSNLMYVLYGDEPHE
jgi:hypothetical protein